MDLSKYFEEGWYSKLKHYLESDEFEKIAIQISKDRVKETIIPEKGSELFLKVFRVTPYNNLTVNILGQDPYYNPPDAFDGLAFSNSNSYHAQPSLRNILEEVENDIYDGFNLERISNFSLYNWASQGVFLNNTAHTVVLNKPESHLHYWEKFTIEVMKAINEKDNVVHLLWGRKAQKYKTYITNITHKIIETSHPSPLSCYNNAPIPFTDSKCFSKTNTFLKEMGKKEIVW